MIEKSCMVCNYDDCGNEICYSCHGNGYPKFEPSELYTAYLQERERAERFRQALNCEKCVDGYVVSYEDTDKPCPTCTDIREEAKPNE